MNTTWSPADLARLEDSLGVVMPAAFRQYLRSDPKHVLDPDQMLAAFGFLSAHGERLLGRRLKADAPFPITPADMASLLVHYHHREAGTGLDRLLFPGDGWLPIVSHKTGFFPDQSNACDVLVTAGAFRGCVLYADYGYRWWWPYLSAVENEPSPVAPAMSFDEFSRVHLTAAPGPARTPRPWCPRCGVEAIPVLYGRLNSDGLTLVKLGVVSAGGCLVGPDLPRWSCPQCHAGFGRLAGIAE